MKKYEFTNETIEVGGVTLRRIRRLSDGLLGGYLQSEDNLSHDGNAWVSGDAQVSGTARVYGDAWVYGEKIEFPGEQIPVVKGLHAKILAAIDAGGALDMGSWHTCETTHCRAGWAIHLAGKRGAELETKYGAWLAGAAIEMASTPALKKIPDYFAKVDVALAEIKALAGAV